MFLTNSQLLLHVNIEEWGNGYHALNKQLRKTREAISGVSGDRLKGGSLNTFIHFCPHRKPLQKRKHPTKVEKSE